MSVIRVRRRSQHPYVMLSRSTLRLPAVSLKARGLWAVCMSFPDDWEFRLDHLAGLSESDGVTAVRSALKELRSAGLADLVTLRDGNRAAGKRWEIYEEPGLAAESEMQETCTSGGSDMQETRTSGNPDVSVSAPNVLESKEDEYLKKQQHGGADAPERDAAAAFDGDASDAGEGQESPAPTRPDGPSAPRSGDPSDPRNVAFAALTARGVDAPVARDLAAAFTDRVLPLCARFDAEPARAPGWLVSAVRQGWDPSVRPSPPPSKQAARATGPSPEAQRGTRQALRLIAEDGQRQQRRVDLDAMAAIAEEERLATLAKLPPTVGGPDRARRDHPARRAPRQPVEARGPTDAVVLDEMAPAEVAP